MRRIDLRAIIEETNFNSNINITNKRNIGLDCLRIISMIMIVFLHYLGKGGLLDIENTSNLYHIIYYFIEALSIIAVNCYVLINGYFLIKSKFKWKKVLQLWLETLFYSVFIYIVIIALGLKEISVKGIIFSLFPILTKEYWFINIYLVMYILSPFINKLINSLDKKEYQKLIIILLICFSIISILPDEYTLDTSHGYGIIWFICLYLIAGYIRIYGIPKKFKVNKNFYFLIIYFIFAILVTIGMLVSDFVGDFLGIGISREKFIQYNNIFVLIELIALFMFFKQLNIKNIKVIKIVEFIAPLTLAVYLIHEQSQLRTVLYNKILHTEICYHNPYEIFIMIGSVLAIFIVCIIIEFIRQKIVNRKKLIKNLNINN